MNLKLLVGLTLGTFLLFSESKATNYQQYYNQNQVVVKQRVVQFDSRYYLGLNGYYEVGEQIKDKRRDERLEALQEEHNELKAQLKTLVDILSKQNNVPSTPKAEPTEPKDTPTEPENPTKDATPSDDGYAPTELDKKVYQLFKTKNCAQCHNEKDKKGGIQLVNLANGALISLPLEDRVLVERVTRAVNLKDLGLKRMPLNASALSDEDVQILYDWSLEEALRLRKENK